MAPAASCTHDSVFVNRLLDAIEHDVVPKTSDGVKQGNKLFGAAILRKSDLSLVCADTNKEMEWPLLHGEVSCLRTLNSMPAESRPAPKDCVFIATHEPCSLCLSAITWSGFDNFYYLFSYVDTKDAFNIPHDLKILKEVFGCDGGCYRRENNYWTCHDINKLVADLPSEDAEAGTKRIQQLKAKYDGLST
jgi:tRNA(Arg) A34 adenosine deaminase TadA